MRTFIIALLLSAAVSQAAPATFHVTTVRNLQPNDPQPISRGPRIFVIEGTLDGKRITAQQMFFGWGERFAVGSDYEVQKADGRNLTVVMHSKKGREIKEHLDVTGVSE